MGGRSLKFCRLNWNDFHAMDTLAFLILVGGIFSYIYDKSIFHRRYYCDKSISGRPIWYSLPLSLVDWVLSSRVGVNLFSTTVVKAKGEINQAFKDPRQRSSIFDRCVVWWLMMSPKTAPPNCTHRWIFGKKTTQIIIIILFSSREAYLFRLDEEAVGKRCNT